MTVFVIINWNSYFWLVISRFVTDFCHLSLKRGFVKRAPSFAFQWWWHRSEWFIRGRKVMSLYNSLHFLFSFFKPPCPSFQFDSLDLLWRGEKCNFFPGGWRWLNLIRHFLRLFGSTSTRSKPRSSAFACIIFNALFTLKGQFELWQRWHILYLPPYYLLYLVKMKK